jgi:release factor glutamine methyltransferase
MLPSCEITAVDVSRAALHTARRNARELLGREAIRVRRVRSLHKEQNERFQAVVSNPPYVKTSDLKRLAPEVRREPRRALDGGADGLRSYRTLLSAGRHCLVRGGHMVLEIDPHLLNSLMELPQYREYRLRKIGRDLSGAERVLVLSRRE